MSSPPDDEGWHTIVEVQPIRRPDDWSRETAGAFVPVLALARDEAHLGEIVAEALYDEGFVVVAWGEITTFDLAYQDWDTDSMRELHAHLCEAHPVQFSHFYTYPKDGLDA